MPTIKKDKGELFELFKQEILPFFNIKTICQKWLLNKGTINRWIENKEIPLNYFNHINKLLNFKYTLELNELEQYKNLDQFFTNPIVATEIINDTLHFIEKHWELSLKEYVCIEPSAGNGSFSKNIPVEKFKSVIAFDLEPLDKTITKQDWIDFKPTNLKNIVIGNPPFGLRGQLALQFINHAANFADFVCFILPPLFNSNGKGSPMTRVDKRLKLVHQFNLKNTTFFFPNGSPVEVNGIFQIWTKLPSQTISPIKIEKKESEYIKVFSLSNGNTTSSKRNIKMIGVCDFYLPSTTFKEVKLFNNFEELPHSRGYGIVILKDKEKIIKTMQEVNWEEVCFKSTNAAKNLRTQLIINVVNELTKKKEIKW